MFKNSKQNKIENNNIYEAFQEFSNPIAETVSSKVTLSNVYQEKAKPKFDRDVMDILNIVRIINNLAPIRMPVYNFNLDEINGEYYYRPDGTLLLVREYDNDIIRDYYANPNPDDEYSVSKILERDKNTGRLKVKIEPAKRQGGRLKTNVIIFDTKINNKYTLIQLTEDGLVNNISEFTDNGKNFQTLFRNIQTFKPARYLEGKEETKEGFVMIDCIFDENGNIARIKKYNNRQKQDITYSENSKSITSKSY